jgi:hypothetical protein
MRKLSLAVVLLSLPLAALADSWKGVSLVDQMCHDQMKDKADSHPTSCALKCAESGYGIFTEDGKWLKLDAKGNQAAVAALKKTKKTDHIRANVEGTLKGDVVHVASLSIPD